MPIAFSTLEVSTRRAGVAQVTMARPAVFNAFDEAMVAELDAAFESLGADDTVRVIVLAGAGPHFSAGADLQWMQRASRASLAWNVDDARRFASMMARVQQCPKPTVARLQGAALGGGVGLACACDIAVAADTASFAVSESRFGILPSVIAPYLINAVGARQAQRLALTAVRIGADEARQIGLVHTVSPLDQLDVVLDQAVDALIAAGPQAQRELKQLFGRLSGCPAGPVSPEVRELCAQTIARVRGSDEAREGFAAFLEKRPAAWRAGS